MTQHATRLSAEDGTYFKKHATREAGLEYVGDQMGHTNPSCCTPDGMTSYTDDYGRTITLCECSDDEYDYIVDEEITYGRMVQGS